MPTVTATRSPKGGKPGFVKVLVHNCALSAAADALHEACRATGGLVVAALAVPGGTGCTVNPLLLV